MAWASESISLLRHCVTEQEALCHVHIFISFKPMLELTTPCFARWRPTQSEVQSSSRLGSSSSRPASRHSAAGLACISAPAAWVHRRGSHWTRLVAGRTALLQAPANPRWRSIWDGKGTCNSASVINAPVTEGEERRIMRQAGRRWHFAAMTELHLGRPAQREALPRARNGELLGNV